MILYDEKSVKCVNAFYAFESPIKIKCHEWPLNFEAMNSNVTSIFVNCLNANGMSKVNVANSMTVNAMNSKIDNKLAAVLCLKVKYNSS